MKKRILSIVLIAAMILSVMPAISLNVFSAQGDLPATVSVEPSDANGLPAAINLYHVSDATYHLYLPGNVDARTCFFSWSDDVTAFDGTAYHTSGTLPIPAPNQTVTYTFVDEAMEVTTYQGSEMVKPIFIEIDESKGTIAAMNSSSDHSVACSGKIYIDGEEHTLSSIKGRGNATWYMAKEKRPYNLTLGKKTNILGIDSAKTKKWSILANIADHTLLRNKIGYDVAHSLGIGQDSASADVWMNGEYQGTYLVTPKTDSFTSDDGYSLENDNYYEPPISEGGDPSFSLNGLQSASNNRITVKKIGDNLLMLNGKVDESVENLTRISAEIQSYMQDAWDAIRSYTGYNRKGKYYTDYIDLDSWAAMYLMQEYVKNYDANAGSILFHRDGTTEADKLIAGPLWDLDNALGSTQRNGSLGDLVDLGNAAGVFLQNLGDEKTSIFKTLGGHADFMAAVRRVYQQNYMLIDSIPDMVRAEADKIAASANMNFRKVTKESYNNAGCGFTIKEAGTLYAQQYKTTNTWQDYVDNLVTFTSTRSLFLRDYFAIGHLVTFEYSSKASVTSFDTPDDASTGREAVRSAYARDSKTGEIADDDTGEVNFRVNVSDGYELAAVIAEPMQNYDTLLRPADTNGCYRLTNVTGPIQVTIKTQKVGWSNMASTTIDFTDPNAAGQIEIIHPDVSAIREGEGLYLITTRDAMEDCAGQNSGTLATTPKDLVSVPVFGDWTATLEFTLDFGTATNGYYQYFGFYAAQDKDYQNLAGIRVGDAAMQDFIRKHGSITSETMNRESGFSSAGNYILRIVKENTTYTCYRSDNGKDFSELFCYTDTGIEADNLIIDAYTGLTEGYIFLLKRLDIDCTSTAPHEHSFEKSTTYPPTCTEDGYTLGTCACGETIVQDERVPAMGHRFADGVCTRCGAKDPNYAVACPSKAFADVPAEGTWAHKGIDYCVKNGLMNGLNATTFAPDDTVTRAQLVTILYRAAGKPAVEFKNTFTDVKPGTWYRAAVEWAAANGIVKGVSADRFSPDSEITREQIATILYRYCGNPAVRGELSSFADRGSVSAFAVTALLWATENGLIKGIPSGNATNLSPKSGATRAQIATIIMRYEEMKK